MLRAINKLLPIEFHIIVNEAFLKLKLCAAMMAFGKQAKCVKLDAWHTYFSGSA
jgi:hypothetical protein